VLRTLSSIFFAFALAAFAAEGGLPQQPARNDTPSNPSPTNQPPTNQPPANQSPTNQSPTNQSPSSQDPAAVVFATEAGMVLHAVKPGSVADYEAAILQLKEALAKAEDSEVQALARGWRVYKATEPDAKSSVIFVHMLDPAMPGVDYRPSLWLDKLLNGAPADLLAKYRDAFAVPPSKLSLTELKKP
jgi:hypothetical protein